jgi:hypothetical protein
MSRSVAALLPVGPTHRCGDQGKRDTVGKVSPRAIRWHRVCPVAGPGLEPASLLPSDRLPGPSTWTNATPLDRSRRALSNGTAFARLTCPVRWLPYYRWAPLTGAGTRANVIPLERSRPGLSVGIAFARLRGRGSNPQTFFHLTVCRDRAPGQPRHRCIGLAEPFPTVPRLPGWRVPLRVFPITGGHPSPWVGFGGPLRPSDRSQRSRRAAVG